MLQNINKSYYGLRTSKSTQAQGKRMRVQVWTNLDKLKKNQRDHGSTRRAQNTRRYNRAYNTMLRDLLSFMCIFVPVDGEGHNYGTVWR